MASNWTKARFEDLLVEPVRNGIYKKKEFHGRGAKIVNMGELFRYPRLTDVEMKRVELTSNEIPKVLLNSGDLLFARRSLTAEGAGKCSIVKEVNEPTTFESSIIRARPNPDLADSDFLYYLYSSEIGYNLLDTIRRSVAVSGITGGDLKNLELDVPPLPEQKAISHILGSLDDKIELNRRMNETLEGMAQALFKSWFVDFDPVIDNALASGNPIPEEFAARARLRQGYAGQAEAQEGVPTIGKAATEFSNVRKLFPDSFQSSELGPIPTGWEVSTIGEEVDSCGGATPSTKNPEFWNEGDIHWTTPKDLSNLNSRVLLDTDRKITEAGLNKISSGLLPVDTVLMSSRAPVGYLALAKVPVAINQGYIAMKCTKKLTPEYVIQWADSVMDDIKQRAGGTTFAEISKKNFRGIPVIVPEIGALEIYSQTVKGFYSKITDNLKESSQLEKLRDTLLPKLISGELSLERKLISGGQ